MNDEQVLPSKAVRIETGLGLAELAVERSEGPTYHIVGSGLNLEAALGVGHDLEVGLRLGLRPIERGRALRADEVARLADSETFGTGIGAVPSPELRLRWRLVDSLGFEAGVEDRIVVPVDDEHRACEVLGLWASLHLSHSARIDGGINAALAWLSLTGGSVMQPALGVPIRVWSNIRFPWFVGLISSAHVFGATAYTSSYLKVTTGLAFGYRLGRCDIMQSTVAMDALRHFTALLGIAVAMSCRI